MNKTPPTTKSRSRLSGTNSSIPSNDELEQFNKSELLAFLKSRGVKQTGNKDILLSVAKLVAKRPVITVSLSIAV